MLSKHTLRLKDQTIFFIFSLCVGILMVIKYNGLNCENLLWVARLSFVIKLRQLFGVWGTNCCRGPRWTSRGADPGRDHAGGAAVGVPRIDWFYHHDCCLHAACLIRFPIRDTKVRYIIRETALPTSNIEHKRNTLGDTHWSTYFCFLFTRTTKLPKDSWKTRLRYLHNLK